MATTMKSTEAAVIRPDLFDENEYCKETTLVECDCCGLEYSLGDYDKLLSSKKLAYFLYEDFIICYECFFKEMVNIAGGDILRAHITDGEDGYVLRFSPDIEEGYEIE